MQLDRTHVAIRPRSLAEIGDLAMMLLRQYPQAIVVGFTMGALPWMLLNLLLLGWIPLSETPETRYDEETASERYRYVWLMCVMIFFETPFAGVFTTTYIGQAVFEQRPTWYRVLKDTFRLFPRLLLTLGLLRGVIPGALLIFVVWGQPFMPGVEVGWMLLLCSIVMITRAVRPFLPEIMLLERCPIFVRGTDVISLKRRSNLLHGPISGDLIGRFILVSTIISLMALAIFYGYWFLTSSLFGIAEWSSFVSLFLFPLAVWTASGFSVLVRFLSYLDSRIRLEGWEVELLLRAESIRQFGTHESKGAA